MFFLTAIVNQDRAELSRQHASHTASGDLGMIVGENDDLKTLKHKISVAEEPPRGQFKKVILPAAGFGVRAGAPLSKEMLPHPGTGRPLIEEVLRRLAQFKLRAHVIVRKEKTNLIEFLTHFENVDVQLVDATQEWPDSVLRSKDFWAEENLLYLPDSEFAPLEMIDSLFEALTQYAVAFAGFAVEDPTQWGLVRFHDHGFEIADKPQDSKTPSAPAWAWGLIAFRKDIGGELFAKILLSNQQKDWQRLGVSARAFQLEKYSDLTRTWRES